MQMLVHDGNLSMGRNGTGNKKFHKNLIVQKIWDSVKYLHLSLNLNKQKNFHLKRSLAHLKRTFRQRKKNQLISKMKLLLNSLKSIFLRRKKIQSRVMQNLHCKDQTPSLKKCIKIQFLIALRHKQSQISKKIIKFQKHIIKPSMINNQTLEMIIKTHPQEK